MNDQQQILDSLLCIGPNLFFSEFLVFLLIVISRQCSCYVLIWEIEFKHVMQITSMENVIIFGGGISGLTAAIYCARANLKPVVVVGMAPDQLSTTTMVENYPGYENGILGPELTKVTKAQAQRFGTRFIEEDLEQFEVTKDGYFTAYVAGQRIDAKTAIIATGASPRMLGVNGEKKYFARGVSTCCTCDGAFYKNKDVIIIGGGDTAMEEALTMTHHTNKITIIHRKDEFRASKIMQQRVTENSNIKIMWSTTIEEIIGDEKKVTAVKLKDLKTNYISERPVDGIFLAIGHIPNSNVFKGIVDMDENGYIKADPVTMQTNIPGLYAAGDVQDAIYRQAVTAAGTGCAAAIQVERYLSKTGK